MKHLILNQGFQGVFTVSIFKSLPLSNENSQTKITGHPHDKLARIIHRKLSKLQVDLLILSLKLEPVPGIFLSCISSKLLILLIQPSASNASVAHIHLFGGWTTPPKGLFFANSDDHGVFERHGSVLQSQIMPIWVMVYSYKEQWCCARGTYIYIYIYIYTYIPPNIK